MLLEVTYKDETYQINRPSPIDFTKAKEFSAGVFRKAIENKAYFKETLYKILKDQGVITQEKLEELESIDKQIQEKLKELSETEDANKKQSLSLDIKILRIGRDAIYSTFSQFDKFTVEAQVDNAEFDFLVSCVCVQGQERVFKSVEDYREKSTQDYAIFLAKHVAEQLYGLTLDFEEDQYLT